MNNEQSSQDDPQTSSRNENTNTDTPTFQHEQESEAEPKKQRMLGRIWQIILIVGIFITLSSILKLYAPVQNGISNMFTDTTTFDINLYISNTSGYSGTKNGIKIHQIPNKTYKFFIGDSSNEVVENIDLNFTYNLSQIQRLKTKKTASIYLIAEISLNDKKKKLELLRKIKVPIEYLYPSINIIKYVENLADKLRQADMMNDIELATMKGDDNLTLATGEDSNYISHLYYKPKITLYNIPMRDLEDITIIQQYKAVKIPFFINYEERSFFPLIEMSDFWTMNSALIPLNKTDAFNITINFSYNFMRPFIYSNLQGIQMQDILMETTFGMPGMKDILVELFLNNSISYLTILFTVNIFHSLFSILGFSNDISYYSKLKRLDGVYTKYIFFNIFQQLIAIIYILIQGSSFIIKIELFIGLCIELWKMNIIFKVYFNKIFPYIHYDYRMLYLEEENKSHESYAINIMIKWLLIPVSILYLIYHFYYYSKKSIWRFIIEYIFFMLSTYGFILMTPQLFLNYQMKSVENLPLRAMAYKFLNTIIDDLYAFALKSPTMYRIFCFRDDVVFVIYLYQIFIYRNNNRLEQKEKMIERQKLLESKKNN